MRYRDGYSSRSAFFSPWDSRLFPRGGGGGGSKVIDQDPGHEEAKYQLQLYDYCNDLYTLVSPSARRVVLMIPLRKVRHREDLWCKPPF